MPSMHMFFTAVPTRHSDTKSKSLNFSQSQVLQKMVPLPYTSTADAGRAQISSFWALHLVTTVNSTLALSTSTQEMQGYYKYMKQILAGNGSLVRKLFITLKQTKRHNSGSN